MSTISTSHRIARPVSAVWDALADFASISAWAGNVDHSSAASEGPIGVGTVRRVQAGRITLLEEIVTWQPGVELAYQLIGLPPPAGTVITAWTLTERDGATDVTITTTINPLPGPPGKIVSKVLGRQLVAAADAMLAGLDHHVTAPALEAQR